MIGKQAFWKRVGFASDKPLGVIADSCGIKRSRMYSFKSKDLYPNAIECLALSNALGTSIQYLLTGEAPPLPECLCKEALVFEWYNEFKASRWISCFLFLSCFFLFPTPKDIKTPNE